MASRIARAKPSRLPTREGWTTAEIAGRLNIAVRTVRRYLAEIRATQPEPKVTREPRRPAGPVTKHGTRAGAEAHRRRGERACHECAVAKRAYDRAWLKSKKEAS
ncbi:hypothetical protein GCM10025865_00930 [Paraoerskovia sediminicola]|uniref:RNA polymerase sigma factor 70 region 4 type 2 domain-containing protein n=1 Tax=Paraoerskovia sediminicola TaxID=1138587 RepID=A0ABM8FYH2_9CELL|nr:hypothetical protein GCM10025865_00930 [Paraoerskovia sediminicola]